MACTRPTRNQEKGGAGRKAVRGDMHKHLWAVKALSLHASIEVTLCMADEELLVKLKAMRLLAFKACQNKRGSDQRRSMAT
jgi:hypothetical protein